MNSRLRQFGTALALLQAIGGMLSAQAGPAAAHPATSVSGAKTPSGAAATRARLEARPIRRRTTDLPAGNTAYAVSPGVSVQYGAGDSGGTGSGAEYAVSSGVSVEKQTADGTGGGNANGNDYVVSAGVSVEKQTAAGGTGGSDGTEFVVSPGVSVEKLTADGTGGGVTDSSLFVVSPGVSVEKLTTSGGGPTDAFLYIVSPGVSVQRTAVDGYTLTTTITGGLADGATICTSSPLFSFAASSTDPSPSFTFVYRVDGGAWQGPIQAISVLLSPLSDGSHTFEVAAIDELGNEDPNPAKRTFTVDTAPPVLSAVLTAPAVVGATVTWNTDKPATSQVEYRLPGTALWNESALGTALVTAHSVTLTGLTPATKYEYRVVSTDACGQGTLSDIKSFTTIPDPPPTTSITDGPADGGAVCGSTATFTFTGTDDYTPVAALRYEYRVDGGLWSAPTLVTTVTLTGMTDGTHTFEVVAVNEANAVDTHLAKRTFTVDAQPPVLTALTAGALTLTSAVVTWTTDKPATSQVDYRLSGTTAWISTTLDSNFVTAHSVTLSALLPGKTYDFRARSADGCGQETISLVQTLTTVADTLPPVTTITDGPTEGATVCGDAVTFTLAGSDNYTLAANLRYQYRVDGGLWSAVQTAATITLTGLSDGPHTFEVAAVDEAGNVDPHPVKRTFTVDTAPPTLSAVAVLAATETATITWTTDKPATSQVEYRVSGTTDWSSTPLDSTLVTAHSVALSGLQASVAYDFRVESSDTCGHAVASPVQNFTTQNPVPVITSLSPASAFVGATGVILTIQGSGFLTGSTVTFGTLTGLVPVVGSVTATQLQVTVPSTALTTVGSISVTVTNPVPGGGTSNAAVFTVLNPAPVIAGLSPASAVAGSQDFALTITGNSFVAGATVQFGTDILTPVADSLTTSHLTVSVPAVDVANPGLITVTVTNPSPGGGLSNALSFSITNPVPTLTGLSPPSTLVGGPDFMLTLTGTGFNTSSVVQFGAHTLTPNPGSLTATRFTITVPAADITTLDLISVNVVNAAPGGGISNALTFQVGNPVPVISALSPASVRVNASGVMLTIRGGSFAAGATVTFGTVTGLVPVAGSQTSSQLQVAVPGSALMTPGTIQVRVVNPAPGGGPSNALPFIVNPARPDLQVPVVTAPVQTYTDSSFDLVWTDANTGHAAAVGPWHDYIYISPDTDPTHGTKIGDFEFDGSLAAGQNINRDQVIQIPSAAVPADGSYKMLVVTNATGAVDEEDAPNDVNNVGSVTLSVRRLPRADLQVTSVQAPAAATSGQIIGLAFQVTNKGAAATNASYWSDHAYLSTTPDISGQVADLGTSQNGSYLNVNQAYTTTRTITLPLTIAGRLYIVVQTDSGNQVTESNESNNVAASAPIQVNQGPTGFLHVTSVTTNPAPPSPIFGGSNVVVNWSVKNTGQTTIAQGGPGYWDDALALSPTPTYDGVHGYFLGGHNGTDRVGPLAVGETYSHQRSITLPNEISGAWYVVAIPDTQRVAGGFGPGGSNVPRDTGSAQLVITPIGAADLIVSAVGAVAPAAPGQPISVQWTVTNQGADDTPVASWTDGVYLSPTPTFDKATATLLGSVPHSGVLGAGMDYSQSALLAPPPCLSGTYYIFVFTDAGNQVHEYDPTLDAEANNMKGAIQPLIVTAPPAPDLIVASVTAAGPVTAGTSFSITWSVKNQGGGAATAPWTDTVYLSKSAVFNVSAFQVGSFGAPSSLTAGQSYTQAQQVTLPANLSGPYYVYIVTNSATQTSAGGVVNECGAANNNTGGTSGPVQIIASKQAQPYLTASQVTAPSSSQSGQTISLRWTVTNTGSASTVNGSWTDSIYLSSTTDSSGLLLGSVSHAGDLLPGGSYQGTTTVTLPLKTFGAYYLVVVPGALPNMPASAPIQLLTYPLADLLVSSVTAPTSAYSGDSMTVNWTVANSGDGPTDVDMWDDTVYLSRDQVHDPTDIPVGYLHHVGALAQGGSYRAGTSISIPPGLSGPYYVVISTDLNRGVLEKDYTNNDGLSSPATLLTIPPPSDLVVGSVTAPATAVPGQPTTFTWAVANQGVNPVIGKWADAVYVSLSPIFDNTATLVGMVQNTGPLGAGQSYTGTLTAKLPPVDLGQYNIFVRTNIYNTINEADLTNDLGIAPNPMVVDVDTLTLGTPDTGALGNDTDHYYKVQVDAGQTVSFTLNGADANAGNELYVRFGHLPDRGHYDYFGAQAFSAGQAITVPNTQAGIYYILVHGYYEPSAATGYSILARVIPFSITSVSPNVGGNSGEATVVIDGALFQAGATVHLARSGQNDVIPIQEQVGGNGNVIAAVFDLRESPAGKYDVVVTNPDGGKATFPQGFEVVSGGGPTLITSVTGPTSVRAGSKFTDYVTVQNIGNTDALFVTVSIAIPAGSKFKIPADQFTLLPAQTGDHPDASSLPLSVDENGQTYVTLVIPRVPAGGVVSVPDGATAPGNNSQATSLIPIMVTPPSGINQVPVSAAAADSTASDLSQTPLPSGAFTQELPDSCWQAALVSGTSSALDLALELTGAGSIYKCGKGLVYTGIDTYQGYKGIADAKDTAERNTEIGFTLATTVFDLVGDVLDCGKAVGLTVLKDNPYVLTASAVVLVGSTALGLASTIYECTRPNPATLTTRQVRSSDPNDKFGPLGVGTQQWVSASQPLPYTVDFENVATATAPAHRITITDTLDPSLDPRSFRLGEITFGDTTVTIPANRSHFQTEIDLGPSHANLKADISAGIDVVNHQAIWSIVAVDPATNLETQDPTIGLLPPDDATHRGEGHVLYTIKPTAGSATGTVVNNTATIVFDTNEPINTNTWTNTLDAETPISKVTALPAVSAPAFTVSWAGTDGKAALALTYDIYVSDNGGPFTAFLTGTSLTSATFTGTPGHTYGFFSIAHDAAGNVEGSKAVAEATTTVPAGLTDVTDQVKVTGSGLIYNRAKKTFNGTLTVVNTGTGALAGPVQVVFSNLPAGVTLINATGTTGGSPYMTISAGALAAGATVTVPVQFTNSGTAAIAYTNRVYSGTF